MNPLTETIYESICSYCNDTIGYTLYTKDGDVINNYNPVCKPNTLIVESHGLCKKCEPEVYKQNGLEKEYESILEQRINKGE